MADLDQAITAYRDRYQNPQSSLLQLVVMPLIGICLVGLLWRLGALFLLAGLAAAFFYYRRFSDRLAGICVAALAITALLTSVLQMSIAVLLIGLALGAAGYVYSSKLEGRAADPKRDYPDLLLGLLAPFRGLLARYFQL